ncbi:Peptidyl-prolyl cis-trans isomerase CYP59 [Galdieria sulphuraria]|nr:Peptidyl-prolyl cis-trans isomerase CYP59 [Galdieria sulphuraria]
MLTRVLLYKQVTRQIQFTPKLRHNRKGRVSMANAGQPNTNGIEEGWETVEAIESVLVDEKKKPFQVIRIYHTIILDDPFPDPPVRLDDDEIWQEEEGMDSERERKVET